MSLRIATVPYCNAIPLVHCLPECLPGVAVSEWYPSAMKQQLAEGAIDLALMPVAELFTLPKADIVSNCCIACNGPVQSVLLFSRTPIEQICSIALDTASRSSAMICEMLLRNFYGIQPEKHCLEMEQQPGDCRTDAFLLIGDRALVFRPSEDWIYRYDIGELWKAKTGLPLVFAAWIGRDTLKDEEPHIVSALEESRDRGVRNIESILDIKERQGIVLPMNRKQMLDYYRHSILYTLGESERAGLQYFQRYCQEAAFKVHPESGF